ncbi:MAG: hypothetical protein U0K28_02400, partial [Prevotellamassilia sp.]|nr:hypothetical protein [Prevotellamassilia sp.]
RFIRRKKAQKKRFQIANLCLMKMKKRDNVEMTWLMVFGSCVFPAAGRSDETARRSDGAPGRNDGAARRSDLMS